MSFSYMTKPDLNKFCPCKKVSKMFRVMTEGVIRLVPKITLQIFTFVLIREKYNQV